MKLTQPSPQLWEKLKQVKTHEAREAIPEECYTRNLRKTFLWFALDLSVFALGMVLVFSNPHVGFKILGGLISGVATAMLFVWAHDAAHGTLFESSKVSEFLGTIAMFPSLNIYRMWSYGHNRVHHGHTSFSPIDWIWRPLTPSQYQEMSSFQRLLYRVERSFFGCAFHYLRRIWWREMLSYNPGKNKEKRDYYRNGKIVVMIYGLVASIVAYQFAGGPIGILTAVILPFIVFNYFIAMIVYLHHTHPEIPFFDIKKEWSHTIGIMFCSTIIHCTKISSIVLHNIMTHIPHHLDIRIPFYHLPRAYEALKKEYGESFHEYQFKWSYVRNIFKRCKLYDFEKNVWMTFEEGKVSG